MGQDGGLMAAMIGSSLLGGLTAPEGQELHAFTQPDINPSTMLGEGKALTNDYLQALIEDASRPVQLRTTVNPLPSFVGGALPMAISAPGMDPNRLNPQLRNMTQGLNIQRRRLTGSDGLLPGAPNEGAGNAANEQALAAMQALGF